MRCSPTPKLTLYLPHRNCRKTQHLNGYYLTLLGFLTLGRAYEKAREKKARRLTEVRRGACAENTLKTEISTAFLTRPVGSVLITCFLVNSLGNYNGEEGGNTTPTDGNLTITEELTPFPPTTENQDPTTTANFTTRSS